MRQQRFLALNWMTAVKEAVIVIYQRQTVALGEYYSVEQARLQTCHVTMLLPEGDRSRQDRSRHPKTTKPGLN